MRTDMALAWTPEPSDYAKRYHALASGVSETGLRGLVISPGTDLRYLTGFGGTSHERLSALVVSPTVAFVVCPVLERPGWVGTAAEASGLEFVTWSDGDDPYALVVERLNASGALAVDPGMPARHLFGLQAASRSTVVSGEGLLVSQRSRKDADELAALAAIGAAIDRVHARMGEFLQAGRTEREVAGHIADAMITEGHDHPDFVIVGSGPNGASPHHEVSDRVIEDGDVVVVDIGGPAASGYNSDSTRTYFVGTPRDPEAVHVHEIVRAAQQAGVDAASASAPCEAVDAASRAVITEAGYGDFFITRTGHGIGLDVHEAPYMVRGNSDPVEPGHVFSVEPGIYLPGRFGVRIEDIVAIDTDGTSRRLNGSPRDGVLRP